MNGGTIDLRVTSPNGQFYVECTTRFLSRDQLWLSNPLYDELLDALDDDRELADSPFVVHVAPIGQITQAQSIPRLLKAVKEKIVELQARPLPIDELSESLKHPKTDPVLAIEFRRPEHKGERSFVAFTVAEVQDEHDETPLILDSLRKKARRYRILDLPYIISINWCNPKGVRTPGRWGGGDPEIEAVYGLGYFDTMDNSSPQKVCKEGLFLTSQGEPRNCHVSGVLLTRRATPFLSNLSWAFFPNPWATHPVPQLFQRMPNMRVKLYEGADVTLGHQGNLRIDEVAKVELQSLLGVDYPGNGRIPEVVRRRPARVGYLN